VTANEIQEVPRVWHGTTYALLFVISILMQSPLGDTNLTRYFMDYTNTDSIKECRGQRCSFDIANALMRLTSTAVKFRPQPVGTRRNGIGM
jgi:hypothetical protein